MKIKLDDYEKATLESILEWLRKEEQQLKEEEVKLWFDISIENVKNVEFLRKIYRNIKVKETLSDEEKNITYEYKESKNYITYKENSWGYEDKKLEKILKVIISMLQKILPVGTVVVLKEKCYKSMKEIMNKEESVRKTLEKNKIDLDKVKLEETKLVITKRFVKVQDEEKYAEYVGYIYPLGVVDKGQSFIFGSEDIKEILYKGYEDKDERAYVFLMKRTLMLELGKTSASI